MSSSAYAYTALSGPPWWRVFTCRSPARPKGPTATRPSTGRFSIAVRIGPRGASIVPPPPTHTALTLLTDAFHHVAPSARSGHVGSARCARVGAASGRVEIVDDGGPAS